MTQHFFGRKKLVVGIMTVTFGKYHPTSTWTFVCVAGAFFLADFAPSFSEVFTRRVGAFLLAMIKSAVDDCRRVATQQWSRVDFSL